MGPGAFASVSHDEVFTRTRIVNSRISRQEANWVVARAGTRGCPWSLVPRHARLIDADPLFRGGVYDGMLAFWDWFWNSRPSGFAQAKLSKVLHLKRPHAFPILDSRVARAYRGRAAAAAALLSPVLGPHRTNFWAAIRNDLLRPDVQRLITGCRSMALCHEDPVRSLAWMSDVRLLDMLIW
jgi:hypothetical protein